MVLQKILNFMFRFKSKHNSDKYEHKKLSKKELKKTLKIKKDKKDDRDYNVNILLKSSQQIPPKHDLLYWTTPVKNQLSLGSCFTEDTKVKLLNGESLSFKELIKKYIDEL